MATMAPAQERGGQFVPQMGARRLKGIIFLICGVISVVIGLGTLAMLILDVLTKGLGWINIDFLNNFDSRFASRAGIKAALYGSAMVMFFTILTALPLGVMTAVYLEEYAKESRIKRFLQINLSNLAGVPAIIYGLLGLTVFVRWLGLGRSVLAGSFTLALLVLPVIVVATQEAIRAVPSSMREASYALGATKSQTIWHHVLPYAFPGILTGNILAASRAIGETAPLITIGALTFVPFVPENPLDRFTVLPIQIFNWTSKPQQEFHELAAAGIIILLAVLLFMNSIAIVLRQKLRKRF